MAVGARPRAVSGVKPSGPLHLGNLEGAVRSWLTLQHTHELYCLIADWHAYTTVPPSPEQIRHHVNGVAIDLLAAGLDPDRATLFVQSDVPEHAELCLLLAMVTPAAWLERVPTYKHTIATRPEASPSLGLLAYPVLQAADILLYRAAVVPVGRDQLPHIELTREIARRFNHLYGDVFPEPQAHMEGDRIVPGIDGAKMSKSRGNTIDLQDDEATVTRKVMAASTTPSKVHPTDPGVPESCAVCQLRRIYDPAAWQQSWEEDRAGFRGCLQNKRELASMLNDVLAPIRARRLALMTRPREIDAVLAYGARRARDIARRTMEHVRRALHLPSVIRNAP